MKKPTIISAKKAAWKVFSLWVRLKSADWRGMVSCYTCGRTGDHGSFHAGHFLAKNLASTLYFEEDNIRVQCPRCNVFLHGNQAEFMRRLTKEIGQRRVDRLFKLRQKHHQFTVPELVAIREKYQALLNGLENA